MAPLAMGFGMLLMGLGLGFYLYTDAVSVTALIPAFFGAPLFFLGVLARQDKLRMHAMHAAALLGLIGLVVPAVMVVRRVASGAELGNPALEQSLMALLCGVFVALCVKSFIDARRRRRQQQAPP